MVEAAVATPAAPVSGTPAAATVAATPSPAAPEWVAARVPEAYRADPNITKYQSEEEFFKGHVELSKKVGQKLDGMVKVPGDTSTAEERATYNKAIGVPETADGYTLNIPDDLTGYLDPEALAGFKPVFHKLGVPAKMAEQLALAVAEQNQKRLVAWKQKNETVLQAERSKMGEAVWNQKNARGQQALEKIGATLGPEWLQEYAHILETTGLGDNAAFVKLFQFIGDQFAEEGTIEGTVHGVGSIENAKALIAKVSDPNSAEWKTLNGPDGPARQDLLKKKREAFLAVYGNAPA